MWGVSCSCESAAKETEHALELARSESGRAVAEALVR